MAPTERAPVPDPAQPDPQTPSPSDAQALARLLREQAPDLTLRLTDAPVPDALDAATLRAALSELGLPCDHVTDATLAQIRDRAPDVVQRLALDPSLARRFDLDARAVASELDLPRPPGRAQGPRVTAARTRYEGRGDAAEAAALLDSAVLRTLDGSAFAGAWQADPVAALIVHAAGTSPGVLSLAIRSLLGAGGTPATRGGDSTANNSPTETVR
ncbi:MULTISPECIES: hypothetical protein [unclassified Streptomyces]|uniref:hypothetical protein n=1 Tax=unclassified Streptomyces TaxID=2593676 RepID=UPI0023672C9C|nr:MULTISPECIES: hypothetical protein [unclassified Streptomyces]MDF3142188.1 hypothetical protein [Streptomyces sp. T21Q-yed]WDF42200.1 hypothetical protein PBV52_38095 [Streptomyces sp. T12]